MPIPLLPLLLGLGGTGLLVSAANRMGTPKKPPTKTAGRRVMSRTYLNELARTLERGERPSDRLIEMAVYEAVSQGRVDVADAIMDKFYEDDDSEEVETNDESPRKTLSEPNTITVSGKSSPLGGVTNEAWSQFVEKLATKPSDFSTDRYVGKYHQRKDRLQELGFDLIESPDDETQYAMLVADLIDAKERAEKFVSDYLGHVVTLDGNEIPVTLSGLLGLLKAAGSRHAESWLKNEADRKQFPQTTAVFVATNGVF